MEAAQVDAPPPPDDVLVVDALDPLELTLRLVRLEQVVRAAGVWLAASLEADPPRRS